MRVSLAPGSDKYLVRDFRTIEVKPIALQRRHHAAGLVHHEVCRGQIPVATVAAGKCGVESSFRDATDPQRQRPDPEMIVFRGRAAHAVEQESWTRHPRNIK